jgi:polypeptide N-acetylgalactosaminyltransferase
MILNHCVDISTTFFPPLTLIVQIFFLHHCLYEFVGWLEPLLARITEDENVIAVPAIDHIDSDTFRYVATSAKDQMRGGFDLDLYFAWIPQSPQENGRRGNFLAPMRSGDEYFKIFN